MEALTKELTEFYSKDCVFSNLLILSIDLAYYGDFAILRINFEQSLQTHLLLLLTRKTIVKSNKKQILTKEAFSDIWQKTLNS